MPKPSLCLNMIVKNEADRIERCLVSVLPYVKSVAILDTGSTDDTESIVRGLCHQFDVGLAFVRGEFKDFSQARNDAFEMAQAHNGKGPMPWCQFALLMDADMELVVEDKDAFAGLDARAFSFDMMQKGGAVSYANRRIVGLHWPKPPYVGVTHEYIDVPAAGMIEGARFIDHADGSNRVNKYERDIKLLKAALKTEPRNARYLYYLANSYRDAGHHAQAMHAYNQRISLGGWDEETHSAMMGLAGVFKDAKDDARFVSAMIEAFNFRPRRAEPLYDLAKHYREKGMNAAALIFAKAGVNIKRPDDLLFVNDFVYSHGLRYEHSIAGYYDEGERARSFEITDDLALDPTCPADIRWSARQNLYFHTKPLSHYCRSFRGQKLDFTPPEGYTAMNPSVVWLDDGVVACNIRCVNYTINEQGQYVINTGGDAIDTRNFIVDLDQTLQGRNPREIVWPRPPGPFNLVTGLEDVRLWQDEGGELCFNACVREQSMLGTCQQIVGRLWHADGSMFETVDKWRIVSGDTQHEKNWMHWEGDKFIYRLDTIIDVSDGSTQKTELKICPDNISGSSQLIPFKSGYIAVVHEAITGPDGKRTYWHRFAWFTHEGQLRRLSLPFVFYARQIEFCTGLAYHPNGNDLIISFGVRDAEAHVATVSIEEVSHMVWKFHEM